MAVLALATRRVLNTGAWGEGAALVDLTEERIAAVPAAWLPTFDCLIRSLRCELRFTRDMAGLPDEGAIDHDLNEECDWYQPSLRPRCRALVAARAGDDASTRRHLEDARRWAERSIDCALEKSEAILAEAILSLLESSRTNTELSTKAAA
jgi:hypothetical protein